MDKGIKKIIDFIEDVTKSSPKGNKGEQFEENIEIFLSQKDFIKVNWKVKNYFNNYFNLKDAEIEKLKEKIKKDISAKYLSQPVKNPFKDFYKNEIYIYISTIWFSKLSWFFNINKKLCYTNRD